MLYSEDTLARSTKSTPPPRMAEKKPRSKWKRRALYAAGGVLVLIPATWLAIHHIPGFGPAVADGVRAVLGPGVVVRGRRTSRVRRAGSINWFATRTPSRRRSGTRRAAPRRRRRWWHRRPRRARTPTRRPRPKDFSAPPKFEAPYANVATDADGAWVPVDDGLGGAPATARARSRIRSEASPRSPWSPSICAAPRSTSSPARKSLPTMKIPSDHRPA